MPICEAVYQILFEGKDSKISVTDLMTRELRGED
jgi:glycerol-3-phosphate dehydrogenase